MRKEFTDYLDTLIEHDTFEVWINEEGRDYAFLVKDNKIGYVQYESMKGLSFSSVHKPGKHGTGFQCSVHYPNLASALNCLDTPAWARRWINELKFYKNWAEYQEKSNLKYIRYESKA